MIGKVKVKSLESMWDAMKRTGCIALEDHACLTGDCDHDTSGDCLEALREQATEERWLLAKPEQVTAASPTTEKSDE